MKESSGKIKENEKKKLSIVRRQHTVIENITYSKYKGDLMGWYKVKLCMPNERREKLSGNVTLVLGKSDNHFVKCFLTVTSNSQSFYCLYLCIIHLGDKRLDNFTERLS